jgi:hypothetical protein
VIFFVHHSRVNAELELNEGQKRKIRRRYADGSSDATAQSTADIQQDYFVNVYTTSLDHVLSQLSVRFEDSTLPVVSQTMVFSAGRLITAQAQTVSADIDVFCAHYGFDAADVCRELNCFAPVFKVSRHQWTM